jgi:hypothetical protein
MSEMEKRILKKLQQDLSQWMFFKQIFSKGVNWNRDFIFRNSTSINYFEQDLKIIFILF